MLLRYVFRIRTLYRDFFLKTAGKLDGNGTFAFLLSLDDQNISLA